MPEKKDGDLSREVFVQYGRASHASVEMERSLVNLATLLEPDAGEAQRGREGEFSGFFRAWDGKPAPSVDRLAARLGWEAAPLKRAVEIRTYLRDHFWQENNDAMYYFDGKRRLVEELTGLAEELISLNERMATEASRLFIRHGLTEKRIAEAVDRIVGPEAAPQAPERAQRIVACVAFRKEPGEKGYIPALKCADDSLMLITREGLIAGPDSPSSAQCVEFFHLSRHFPTVISGSVKSSGPWAWRVPLGNRLELYVERGKGEKGNSVQWGIRNRDELRGDTLPEASG